MAPREPDRTIYRVKRPEAVGEAVLSQHRGMAAAVAANDSVVSAAERLIVALDVPTIEEARALVEKLSDNISIFKLGDWLNLAPGFEALIDELVHSGKDVFVDRKGCDIPETMRAGVAAAAARHIKFLTIHGNGEVNREAMRAAIEGKGQSDLKIFCVTVLTSLDDSDFEAIGLDLSVEDLVCKRAARALNWGCDGVIASGREASMIKDLAGSTPFLVVAPGIRPIGTSTDDHKRAVTPSEAIKGRADYLVVGRPIIRDSRPEQAAARIIDEMQAAFDAL